MTKFICEIGSNHNQNLYRCFEIIEFAKQIGFWGVKFQYFKADTLYKPEMEKEIESMKVKELPFEFIPKIYEFCKKNKIQLGFSVFDLSSPEKLKEHCDFLKISSYEFLWKDLILKCLQTEKDLFLSSGMTNDKEFKNILKFIAGYNINSKICIFHCASLYPAMATHCNLAVLERLKNIIKPYKIGWSDHTNREGVIYEAVANGADYIEMHMDLDGDGWEYGKHCWLPSGAKRVIHNVEVMQAAKGQPIKEALIYEDLDMRVNIETGRRG